MMANDIDPAIAEIVRIALDEIGADLTIVSTSEDDRGLCAALLSPDGQEHSVGIEWHREDGQIAAIELFEDRIRCLAM